MLDESEYREYRVIYEVWSCVFGVPFTFEAVVRARYRGEAEELFKRNHVNVENVRVEANP